MVFEVSYHYFILILRLSATRKHGAQKPLELIFLKNLVITAYMRPGEMAELVMA